MSDKIPTAEEFIRANLWYSKEPKPPHIEPDDVVETVERLSEKMIEFAKFHVKEALKAASKKARLTDFAIEFLQEGAEGAIDDNSILNAYPDNLIQ